MTWVDKGRPPSRTGQRFLSSNVASRLGSLSSAMAIASCNDTKFFLGIKWFCLKLIQSALTRKSRPHRYFPMKPNIIAILLLFGIAARGQTPAEIERQLLVPWERMHYWGSHFSFEDGTIDRVDSLEKADTAFHRAFVKAINNCPACLAYDFPVLQDSGLVITTSGDG